jgi:hypothetical protein
MSPDEYILGVLKKFSRVCSSVSEGELHEIRIMLDLLAGEAATDETTKLAPGEITETLGPWSIGQDSNGEIYWQLKDNIDLVERESWCLRDHSSRRSVPDSTRILVIGESAAGSYGYWNKFSLATALSQKLNKVCPKDSFEVLDLARVNALWQLCIWILQHGLSLQPDVVIVYCGNNEARQLLERLYAGELRGTSSAVAGRWASCGSNLSRFPELLNAVLEEHVENMVRATIALTRSYGVEVVFVIPEYNLRDWRGPERLPYHLGWEQLNHWGRIMAEGERHLLARDSAQALLALRPALRVDGGRCQRSLWAMARALDLSGDYDAARLHYQKARDAGLGPFIRGAPQVTTGVVKILRNVLSEMNVPYVDMPKVFAQHAVDGIPGRDLFLDYCHLNSHGIKILVDAVAALVLEQTQTGRRARSRGDEIACSAPSPREEALASLVGGIHSYHYGQPIELTRYWLQKCIAADPELGKVLTFLCEHNMHFYREGVTVEHMRAAGLAHILDGKYFSYFTKYFYHARFDFSLAALITDILKEPEESFTRRLRAQTETLISDLGGNLHTLFLLDNFSGYIPRGRGAVRGGWERPALEVVANDFTSTVAFPAFYDGPVQLEVDLSSCGMTDDTSCDVFVNGALIGQFALQRRWQRQKIAIAAGILRNGINEIKFVWSKLSTLSDVIEPHLRERFMSRLGPYPAAARIHGLRLSFMPE